MPVDRHPRQRTGTGDSMSAAAMPAMVENRSPAERSESPMKSLVLCAVAALTPFVAVAQAQQMPAVYQQVLDTLGKNGDFKENVLKVNIPRNDVPVTVANVNTPTPFGF